METEIQCDVNNENNPNVINMQKNMDENVVFPDKIAASNVVEEIDTSEPERHQIGVDKYNLLDKDVSEELSSEHSRTSTRKHRIIDSDSEDDNIAETYEKSSDGTLISEDVSRIVIEENLSHVEQNIEVNKIQNDSQLDLEKEGSLTKSKHKRIAIVDSDSEDDLTNGRAPDSLESVSASNSNVKSKKVLKIKKAIFDDSDSDQDHEDKQDINLDHNIENTEDNVSAKMKPKRIAIVDSDSSDEEEVIITPHNKSFENNLVGNNEAPVYSLNRKGELVCEEENDYKELKSKLTALCDSESSDEDYDRRNTDSNLEDGTFRSDKKQQKAKPKSKRTEEDNDKKMTAKQALEQKKEIWSESQRRVRESQVSLPYHKPKPRSIKEFLQKRPKFADALPSEVSRTPPAIAIKMSNAQLEIISKRLEEREKMVVEEFYKSESESEEKNEINQSEEKQNVGDKTEESQENKIENETIDKIADIAEEIRVNPTNIVDEITKATTENLPEQLDNDSITERSKDSAIIADAPEQNQTCNKAENSTSFNTESDANYLEDTENMEVIFNLSDEMDVDTEINALETHVEEGDKHDEILPKAGTPESNSVSDQLEDNVPNAASSNGVNDSVEKSKDQQRLEQLLDKFNFPSAEPIEPSDNKDEESNDAIEQVDLTEESSASKNKLDSIKENLAKTVPKLSGGPDQIIDLEEGVTKPSEVSLLIERFMKHTAKKVPVKHEIKMNITNVDESGIHKETLVMTVDPSESETVISEKPGECLKRLRKELEDQIAQKRTELWLQKQQDGKQAKTDEDVYDGEKSECGADDYLDDDEDAELTDQGSSEEEDMDDYLGKPEKIKPKSDFVDDEAEDEDEIEKEDDVIENDTEEDKEINDIMGADGNEREESKESETDDKEDEEETPKNRKLKRIVKAFEDSDDESSRHSTDSIRNDRMIVQNIEKNLNSKGSWDEDDDDDKLPPNQPVLNHTPRRDFTQCKPDLSFLTPIGHLTGLQGPNSASKFLQESPVISPFQLPPEPSPLRGYKQTVPQKNLFQENDESNTQPSSEELENQCMVKFITNTAEDIVPSTAVEPTQPNTQDLMDLCSGMFTESETPANSDRNSKSTHNVQYINTQLEGSTEIKNLGHDSEDMLISQLLDDEEMQNFKKKFETPLKDQENSSEHVDNSHVGRVLYDSSDEENETVIKRKTKKAIDSDDEDSEEEEFEENEEEINLHDMDSEDELAANENNLHYDNEEFEINEDEEIVKAPVKAKDFLENEAELSESEWGSADEDEKDLDTYDAEAGDLDVFDERKVRTDLEKIHMRQVLDEDNREVKILQELLLEDGEMHGSGRQRQFKWKNIDENGIDFSGRKNDDDDNDAYIEDEGEEEWRKKRFERELFLKQQLEKSQTNEEEEDTSLLSTSQVLKLGQKAIIKNSTSQNSTPPAPQPKAALLSPEVKVPFALKHKRGSFLTRNDKVLQRLAEFSSKIVDTSKVVGAPKNSKNFVFQSVSSSISLEAEATVLKFDKKRKASDGTPNVIKKLRLTNNFSPAGNKKQNKNNSKRLFTLT